MSQLNNHQIQSLKRYLRPINSIINCKKKKQHVSGYALALAHKHPHRRASCSRAPNSRPRSDYLQGPRVCFDWLLKLHQTRGPSDYQSLTVAHHLAPSSASLSVPHWAVIRQSASSSSPCPDPLCITLEQNLRVQLLISFNHFSVLFFFFFFLAGA